MADAAEPKQPYDKHDEDPAHREQRIRERAYSMWEADGRPDGRAEQYWNRAQELIEDENLSAFPPSASGQSHLRVRPILDRGWRRLTGRRRALMGCRTADTCEYARLVRWEKVLDIGQNLVL